MLPRLISLAITRLVFLTPFCVLRPDVSAMTVQKNYFLQPKVFFELDVFLIFFFALDVFVLSNNFVF